MARVRGWRWIYWVCLLCAVTAISSQAQVTFTTLVTFNQTNGEGPDNMALVRGIDGNFYGTTYYGGDVCGFSGCGIIFKMSPSGTLTTLYEFCAQAGARISIDETSPYHQNRLCGSKREMACYQQLS